MHEPAVQGRDVKTPGDPLLLPFPVAVADLRGLSRLAVDGVLGLTDVVDRMHHEVARTARYAGATRDGRTAGLTGAIYGLVRGATRAVGGVADVALDVAARVAGAPAHTAERATFVAALNGVFGDHLADSGNPLAIPMALRHDGRTLDPTGPASLPQLAAAPRRLVVLVHGLCMHDGQWRRGGHDHGAALARDLRATSLYLHYNTGRHVADNGRDFAVLLERLVACWPEPPGEIVIVGHSMGGLVARSACHHAQRAGHRWLAAARSLVFLGTPHHGAALERGGRRLDALLAHSRHAAPLARIGQARSAGITDLRYGNVQRAGRAGRDRHAQVRDDRRPTPLPRGVEAYVVAATRAARRAPLHDRFVGDGVVPLASALGEHADPALALRVPRSHRLVVTEAGHWDLLDRPEVYAQLLRWLGPRRRPRTR